MSAGFETFSDYRIYSRLFTFHRETGRGNDMSYDNTTFVQPSGPCFRISGRSENDLDALFGNNRHDFFNLRIHQGNIDSKGTVCSRTAFPDMFTKSLRMHRACAKQSQSSRITYCGSETPTATPHHATLNNRILNTEKRSNSVHKLIVFQCANLITWNMRHVHI